MYVEHKVNSEKMLDHEKMVNFLN